jgi:hypothetical protein
MALLAPAAAEATFPGANGPIAFEAASKIGVVDPATGATDEAVSSGFGPSLFPGSRRLAYIRVVGFEDPLHRNLMETSIHLKSLHPDHPRAPGRRITGQRALSVRDLAVTPDGRRIVFAAAHPIGYHEPELDIWSISTHGGGLRRLTKNGVFDNDVDVSPDGRRIAYAEKVNGRAQVFLMDIDGSNQHRLTFDGRRDRAPHWSPDGRRIVYFSVPGGGGGRGNGVDDMWSIAATGGRPRHLASNAEAPVYSPDGHQIAFLRDYVIWLMRADGSHQRRLLDSEWGSEITAIDWGSRRSAARSAHHGFRVQGAVGDPLPPDTTITFGPEGWTNLTRPVYGYESDNPEAYFECRLDSGPFEPCGPATYEVLEGHPGAELSEGTHTIEVRAVGPNREADPTPAQAVIMVDADPPTAAIISGPTGVTHRRRPKFRLRVANEDSFWCRILSKGVRIKVRSCDGPTSFRSPHPLAEANYTMIVIAFDRAGNETEDRVEFTVRTKPGPPPNPFRGSVLYSGRNHGVKTVFRLRGDKLIQARISIPLVCTAEGRRYRSRVEGENAAPSRPIVLNKRGGFQRTEERIYSYEDAFERFAGKVTPREIVGVVEVRSRTDIPGGWESCHTGRFGGNMEELSFRARRHRRQP